jgi:predicted lysophospholipase L1 biosynthesis ABC-type transport system permease subunit
VSSAHKILATLFVDFQIVGDVFAVRAIAKNQSVLWMIKSKIFHLKASSDEVCKV